MPALLTLGLILGLLRLATAQDPPHWASVSLNIDCTSQCHIPHQAQGGALSQSASNANLCQQCHNPNPAAPAQDLPISNADSAVRGVTGTSHAFDVPATQDLDGDGVDDVLPPQDAQMSLRVTGGNIICSTCHNQHKSEKIFGGTPRVGNAKMLTANGSIDGLLPGGTFDGAQGLWYLVEITVSGDQNSARFGFSKDNGTSWFPTNCVPGGVTTGCLTAAGANPITLDANGVTVAFATGSYVAADRWELSAGWPFMRAVADNAAEGSLLCRDCHRPWVMVTADVRSWNNGSVKSHPVGVTYPSASETFHPTPLDGNGAAQGGGNADANPSNDLLFDGSNHVECLTCHAVHFVDSNTQTVDMP